MRISEDKGLLKMGLVVGSRRQHCPDSSNALIREQGYIESHVFLQSFHAEAPYIAVQHIRWVFPSRLAYFGWVDTGGTGEVNTGLS